MNLSPFLSLALSTLARNLAAVEVPLDFTIQASSSSNLSYRVGTVLTATHQNLPSQAIHNATVSYSGNILALADVNPSNGALQSIRFTGGVIATSDTLGILRVNVGTTPFQVTFQTSGLIRSATSSTLQVLPSSGFLDGNLHLTTLTSGIVEVSNNNLNNSSSGTVVKTTNFATGSSDLLSGESLFPAGNGASSVGSSLTSNTLFQRNFQVSLFSLIRVPTLAPDATIRVAGLAANQTFKQRYSELGNLSATATFSIPTEFGRWALEHELSLTTGQEKNEAGMPYAVLFALGLDASSTSLPITFGLAGPSVALALPEEGLGFALQVLYSPDLNGPFAPLSASFLPTANPIPKGRVGTLPISLPAGDKGFLRFAVNL